jgi:hypothetical protein
MTRSLIAHANAGTIEQAPSVVEVPVSAYTDPALGLTAGLVDFIADFVKGAAP